MEGRKKRVNEVARMAFVYAGGTYIWFLLLISAAILDVGKYHGWMSAVAFFALMMYSLYCYCESVGFIENILELNKYTHMALSIFVILCVLFSLILLIITSIVEEYKLIVQLAFFLGPILYILYYGNKLITYCKERIKRKKNK